AHNVPAQYVNFEEKPPRDGDGVLTFGHSQRKCVVWVTRLDRFTSFATLRRGFTFVPQRRFAVRGSVPARTDNVVRPSLRRPSPPPAAATRDRAPPARRCSARPMGPARRAPPARPPAGNPTPPPPPVEQPIARAVLPPSRRQRRRRSATARQQGADMTSVS